MDTGGMRGDTGAQTDTRVQWDIGEDRWTWGGHGGDRGTSGGDSEKQERKEKRFINGRGGQGGHWGPPNPEWGTQGTPGRTLRTPGGGGDGGVSLVQGGDSGKWWGGNGVTEGDTPVYAPPAVSPPFLGGGSTLKGGEHPKGGAAP